MKRTNKNVSPNGHVDNCSKRHWRNNTGSMDTSPSIQIQFLRRYKLVLWKRSLDVVKDDQGLTPNEPGRYPPPFNIHPSPPSVIKKYCIYTYLHIHYWSYHLYYYHHHHCFTFLTLITTLVTTQFCTMGSNPNTFTLT